MKLKIILSVLLLFSLLKVDANPLVDISIASLKILIIPWNWILWKESG